MQELYHEFHALDRFEQDYKQKLEEAVSLNLPRKGPYLGGRKEICFLEINVWEKLC